MTNYYLIDAAQMQALVQQMAQATQSVEQLMEWGAAFWLLGIVPLMLVVWFKGRGKG